MQSKQTSCNDSNVNFITWGEVDEANQAKVVADKCVNEVLKSVESFVSGDFHQKSSCSITPLSPKTKKEPHLTEDHRLVNWKRWIKIREKQSDKIRKFTLRRPPQMLLNLNPNDQRSIFSQNEILEKSAAGFGTTNFWKLPEKSRKDLHLTLPLSERVKRSEISYTQTPDLILKEQHIARTKSPINTLKMIQEKVDQEICITQPSLKHLALKGNVFGDGLEHLHRKSKKDSIRLSWKPEKLEETESKSQILVVNGMKIESSFPDVNIHVDIAFERFKMQRQTKTLHLQNLGMIAIDLSFKKASIDVDLSELTHSFFFKKSAFRIVPGGSLEIPFHYYPVETGVHSEKWILNCEPIFSSECQIFLCLFGNCKQKFNNDEVMNELTTSIERKIEKVNVDQLIKKFADSREKFSKVRNLINILLQHFNGDLSEEFNRIKLKMCETVDEMITILESYEK